MLRPETAAKLRDQIRTTQLIKRLEAFALNEDDPQSGKPVEMTPHHVAAILGLVKKTLPDLTATTLSGDGEGGAIALVWHPPT